MGTRTKAGSAYVVRNGFRTLFMMEIQLIGVLIALVSLGVGHSLLRVAPEIWQTMVFTTLTISQMSHVMAIRSGGESLVRVGLLSNKPLLGAITLTALGLGRFEPEPDFGLALNDFLARPTECTHDGLWRHCALDLDGLR